MIYRIYGDNSPSVSSEEYFESEVDWDKLACLLYHFMTVYAVRCRLNIVITDNNAKRRKRKAKKR